MMTKVHTRLYNRFDFRQFSSQAPILTNDHLTMTNAEGNIVGRAAGMMESDESTKEEVETTWGRTSGPPRLTFR
jgi:hypothetical protein